MSTLEEPQGRTGFYLGSIRGTTFEVEPTFLILCAFFVLMNLDQQTPLLHALLWIPVLFVSTIVHEIGHAGVIGALGFGSSQIKLTGYGGVTINSRRSRSWQEVLISGAGPLAGILLAYGIGFLRANVMFASTDPMFAALLPLMQAANWWWAIFNLLPIFYLDGGHLVYHFTRLFIRDRYAFPFSVWSSIVVGVLVVIGSVLIKAFLMAFFIGMIVLKNYQRWQFDRGPRA